MLSLVALLGTMTPAAEAASDLATQEREVSSLRRRVESWHEAPRRWGGLSDRGVEVFLADLRTVLALPPSGDPDNPESEEERDGAPTERWELLLRAASLVETKRDKEGVPAISRSARDILAGTLRTDEHARAWALDRVIIGSRGKGAAKGTGMDFAPTVADRRVTLEILEDAGVKALRLPLLTVVRRSDDPLRSFALGTLARWASTFGPDPSVDLYLVRLADQAFDKSVSPHPLNILLDRLASSDAPLSEQARALLTERIARMLVKSDWREAARGLRLSVGLPVEERVPCLLDALQVWKRRAEGQKEYPSLVRIQNDLVRELRALSGQYHGARPGPWINWWVAVRKGELPMPGSKEFAEAMRERASQPRTTAGFFGLRPESMRVTFVIDASGSMGNGFSTDGTTRYVEAVEQMMRFLQGSPEGTKFNTILFSDLTLSSGADLQDVTPRLLESARAKLLAHTPAGGTNLRPAIEQALRLDASGLPDLEAIEADTIIVLCDGETAEGSRWVKPMLKRVLPAYPILFHCVHLGHKDDGALEQLAEISGGDFIRVGG